MDSTKELLAKRLKQLRKSKGLTQEKLAELIGRDTKHISKLEIAGSYPSIETLDRIADALGIELKDIFNFDSVRGKEFILNEFKDILNDSDEKELQQIYKIYKCVTQ